LRIGSGWTIEPNVKACVPYAVVAIAICSWIAISNHCAFAALATKTDSGQAACPFHSKPANQKQQNVQVQCCKTLRAVVHAQTKTWARDDAKFSDVVLRVRERAIIESSLPRTAPLFLDTGPSSARSFAELILQRSILAHAPPIGS